MTSYKELAERYGVSPDCTRKQLDVIAQILGDDAKIRIRKGRQWHVTPFGEIQLEQFRRLGVEDYRRSQESSSLAIVPSITPEICQPVKVDQFELPDCEPITPRDIVRMLAIRQSEAAIQGSQKSIAANDRNVELLRQTLQMVEEENARARGFQNAARLAELEKQGEAAFVQQQLKARLEG